MGKMVPAAGPMIDRIGAVLQHFWRKAGNRSKVIGGLAPLGEDGFAMLFRPRAAIKTIAFATFENAGELSPLDLQRVFNQIAMGVPYSESRLKELLHYNIRPLYEEKGRLEVTFCPCPGRARSGLGGTPRQHRSAAGRGLYLQLRGTQGDLSRPIASCWTL